MTMTKLLSAVAFSATLAGAAMAEGTTAPVNEVPTQGLMGAGALGASGAAIVAGLAVAVTIASQDDLPPTTSTP